MLDEFKASDMVREDVLQWGDNIPEMEQEADFNLIPEPEVDPEGGTLEGWDSQETPPMGHPPFPWPEG